MTDCHLVADSQILFVLVPPALSVSERVNDRVLSVHNRTLTVSLSSPLIHGYGFWRVIATKLPFENRAKRHPSIPLSELIVLRLGIQEGL